MNFGWVDFSDNDRQKTLELLKILEGQSAVDELGLGVIRDFFADKFFPGTSTIQTRAKYFIIVPQLIKYIYNDPIIMKNIIGNANPYKEFISYLRFLEKKVAFHMHRNNPEKGEEQSKGIIGEASLKEDDEFRSISHEEYKGNEKPWIVRTPSEIYWAGIRTLGIYKGYDSLSHYVRNLINNYNNRDSDQILAEKSRHPYNIDSGIFITKDEGLDTWIQNLNIELTKTEADYLKDKFINCKKQQTVFSSILKGYSEYSKDVQQPLNDLNTILNNKLFELSDENKKYLEFAIKFDEFTYPLKIFYNYCIFSHENYPTKNKEEALNKINDKLIESFNNLLEMLKNKNDPIAELIECIKNEKGGNISSTMKNSLTFLERCNEQIKKLRDQKILEIPQNSGLSTFSKLEVFKELKNIITNRELTLKGKNSRIGKKDLDTSTYGINHYDYRLSRSMVIIKDILNPMKE